MSYPLTKKLIAVECIFLLLLTCCYIIEPNLTFGVDAVSTLGTRLKTFPLYAVGFLLVTYVLLYIARKFPHKNRADRSFKTGLVWISALILGVLATPFTVNSSLFLAHVVLSFALLVTGLVVSIRSVRRHHDDKISYGLIVLQFLGFTVLVLSLREVGILNILGVGQLLYMIAFFGLLTRVVYLSENDTSGK